MGEFIQSKSRWIITLFLIVALSLLVSMAVFSWLGATNLRQFWLWTDAEPKVIYSQSIADVSAMSICPSDLRSAQVVGEGGDVNVCFSVGSGSNIKFGMYRKDNGYIPVVGFAAGSKMYKVTGASCDLYTPCTYIPGSDVLVTKRRLHAGTGESLILFNNFSKRIKKVIDAESITLSYSFDSSNPDYVYTDDPVKTWAVGGYGASENGDWLAIEIREKGMYVLNMHTRELRRISTMTFNYYGGMAPAAELTISNDGSHVAIMGANAYITIYDVISGCGDAANGEQIMATTFLKTPCKQSPINTDKFIPHFFVAYHPRFNSDGSELNFYSAGYQGDQREVVLSAAQYEPYKLNFLALGDSYSSGEGETSDKFYQKGTNDTYEKCHLSTRSYPYLTAKLLGLSDEYVKSVACSGATTNDVIGWTPDYQGQGDRLKNQLLGPQQKDTAITEARENFVPGRILQAIFVEQYQPKVITVGIGGNDVGFMEKLRACLSVDTCEWALTPEGREKTAVEIQGLFWTLLDTYTNLRRLSPQSTIYAVGYPKIIDPNGSCGVPLGLMFDSIERKFMDEGIMYLNQVIAAAAKKAGVHYIDIENSLGDQVLCGGGKLSAMNWIRLGDDVPVVKDYDFSKIIGSESFHPNPTGQDLISKVVASAITSGVVTDACAISDIRCYNSVRPPWPSGYWLFGGVMHDYVLQHNVKFTSDQIGSINGKQKTINMPPGLFDVRSEVRVELHSDPIKILNLTTDENGAIDADINLPTDTPDGYHVLHLYGINPNGEEVDYYDVINTTPVLISRPTVDTSFLVTSNPVTDNTVGAGQDVTDSYRRGEHTLAASSSSNSASLGAVLGDSTQAPRVSKTIASPQSNSLVYTSIGVFVAIIAVLLIARLIFHRYS